MRGVNDIAKKKPTDMSDKLCKQAFPFYLRNLFTVIENFNYYGLIPPTEMDSD